MKTFRTKINVGRLLLGGFTTLSFLIIAAFGLLLFFRDADKFRVEAAHLRENYLNQQKYEVKNEVEKVIDYINYNWSQTEQRLKANIKARTYEADAIAANLQKKFAGKKSTAEIRGLIVEALRPIRFNNGRGYFFATGLDGREILFADHPELEGKDLMNMRDTRGAFVIREMIDLVCRDGEGYYRYTWTKPGESGKDYPKIAYLKYSAPLDGFIGTGEYLDDVERDIQQEVLGRIGKIRFGKDGYIFVVSFDGVTLMNGVQPELIGKPIWDMTDPYGVKVIQEERRAAETPNGDFIRYHWEKPTTRTISPKISFVKGFRQWRWMVGAGVYVDEVESVIAAKEADVKHNARIDFFYLFLILVGFLALAFALSYFFSNFIRKQFEIFLSFFTKMETGGEPIDTSRLITTEFISLGESANTMLARRRQAEDARQQSESRYRLLLQNLNDAVYVHEATPEKAGAIVDVNDQVCRMLGYTRDELLALSVAAIDVPEQAAKLPKILTQVFAEGQALFETEHLAKDRRRIPVEVSARLFELNGQPMILSVVRDITERKRLEAQLIQAQKMESVGRLAGGVAHDFNNILTGISGYAELILAGLHPDDPLATDVTEIKHSAERAAALTSQLLAFSRKQIIAPRQINLNELLTNSTRMIQRLIGEDITLVFDPGPDLGTIQADPNQIEQVLINLAVNARDAMPGGGTLRIETANVEMHEDAAGEPFDTLAGKYVRLAVSDTGCGMSAEVQSHLFEPFFTTKERGKGTGLGLSMVYGIIKQNNGVIRLKSAVGAGTTFTIYWPLVAGEAEQPKRPVSETLPVGSETILLAEDEVMVRNLARKILARQGYRVIAAEGGHQAILAAQDPNLKIDLLLTDVVMPEMNGSQLYQTLAASRPRLKVLFMSGYTEDAVARHGVLDAGVNFVQKPFSVETLIRQVREALDN